MSVDVVAETTIDRPVEEVSSYVADQSNAPEWYENIKSVEWKTPPPAKVGARIAFVASFLGRSIAYTYEIVEFVPGKRLVMRTEEGPFPMETTYTWEPAGERSTRMTLRNRGGRSGLFANLSAPLMALAIRRATGKDLAKLKSILERR